MSEADPVHLQQSHRCNTDDDATCPQRDGSATQHLNSNRAPDSLLDVGSDDAQLDEDPEKDPCRFGPLLPNGLCKVLSSHET